LVQAWAVQRHERVEELEDLIPKDARQFELTVQLARTGDGWKVAAIDGDGIPGDARSF
jgi:hypothetical protein